MKKQNVNIIDNIIATVSSSIKEFYKTIFYYLFNMLYMNYLLLL